MNLDAVVLDRAEAGLALMLVAYPMRHSCSPFAKFRPETATAPSAIVTACARGGGQGVQYNYVTLPAGIP